MRTMSVPSRTLCRTFKMLQMEDSLFGQKETGAKSCYDNRIKGVILFLLRWVIMVPSFQNTALIFLEILFFQHLTIFSCKQYDIITYLIGIIEKR